MLTPTAKASMLVASERVKSMSPRVGSLRRPRRVAAGVPEHLHAHQAQQDERRQAVVTRHAARHPRPGQPAEQGHHKLEQSEMEGEAEGVPGGDFARD